MNISPDKDSTTHTRTKNGLRPQSKNVAALEKLSCHAAVLVATCFASWRQFTLIGLLNGRLWINLFTDPDGISSIYIPERLKDFCQSRSPLCSRQGFCNPVHLVTSLTSFDNLQVAESHRVFITPTGTFLNLCGYLSCAVDLKYCDYLAQFVSLYFSSSQIKEL